MHAQNICMMAWAIPGRHNPNVFNTALINLHKKSACSQLVTAAQDST